MSILDKASFVLAPGGYSEGYVYGLDSPIAPKKLAYSRSATSTRVSPKGLIDYAPYNLFSYTENLTNTSFWFQTQHTVTLDSNPPKGLLSSYRIVDNSSGVLSRFFIQNRVLPLDNTVYTMSGYFKAGEYSYIQLHPSSDAGANFNLAAGTFALIGAGTATMTNAGEGWYRCSYSWTRGSGNCNLHYSPNIGGGYNYNGTSGSGIYMSSLQLEASPTVSTYFPITDRLNVPTLDYSTGKPTYLFEPSITNYALPFSGDVYNATTAPDGNNTATKITYTAGSNYTAVFTFQSSSLTGVRTLSIYAKSAGYNLLLDAGSYSSNNFVIFDLTNGIVSYNPSGLPTTMTNVGNGWYRCTMTSQGTSGGEVGLYSFLITIINGTTTSNFQANNGTSGIFIWGAQLQTGPSATSYIPTTNAYVTRVGGSTGTFGASYFGTNKGTILMGVEGIRSLVTGGSAATIDLQAGGTRVMTFYENSSGIGFYDYYGNAFLCPSDRNAKRMLIKWDGTTSVGFVNGVKTVTLTTGSTRNIDNMTSLGANLNAYNLSVFVIFPEALSDAECIALTS